MARTAVSPFLPARRLLAFGLGCGATLAWAQALAPAAASAASGAGDRNVSEWLARANDASRHRSYAGTFVVSSNTGAMASARIWHTVDGELQVERVESLTGARRSTFRRNEQVVTFLPESHVVRMERRESLGLFTNLLKTADSAIPEFYGARRLGAERVAGFETDLVQLVPRDGLRFGYRIWSERRSGLVVKLQTIDAEGSVLEQSAFSELAMDVPVRAEKLSQMMAAPEGWRIERAEVVKTTPEAEGWQLKAPVPGFRAISCYKRPIAGLPSAEGTMQWVFSDGLAAVSLFLEPFDARRHTQEGVFASGATQTLTHRVQDWWLTAVGEVPAATLRAFAMSLERRR
jgi:sigma-E factor negative regulatory protein RseB